MINLSNASPTAYPNLAFDVVLEPTLRGVLVLVPGTLVFEDITGVEVDIEFEAPDPSASAPSPGCDFPYCLPFQIRRFISSGSTLTSTDVIGLL